VYRLLILDGHSSHLTPEFDLFCKEHLIITLCMPPHSSHLLQPCDVSFFVVLKRLYGQQIQGYIQRRSHHIDKQDFLEAYLITRTEAATIANIQSGFAATALVPHDPERVLSKLRTQLHTPTPPSLSHVIQAPQSWQFQTPHDTVQLELQARAIQNNTVLPTPENRALDQLVKGCQLAMHDAVLQAEEVRQL
jgi:DDE superfamily endonuclease